MNELEWTKPAQADKWNTNEESFEDKNRQLPW